MFRENDRHERRPHPTFSKRDRPFLQYQQQSSHFVPDTVNTCAQKSTLEPAPAPIPLKYDTVYDPSNPRADWGGFVSKKDSQQKTHVYNHRSQQIGIENSEHGIISKHVKDEFTHRRPAGTEIPTSNHETYEYESVKNQNFDRWQTNYKSFEEHEPTGKDQMTFIKRAGTKRVINDPAQMKPQQYYNPKSGAPIFDHSTDIVENRRPSNSIMLPSTIGTSGTCEVSKPKSSTSSIPNGRGSSFISDLGSSLASVIEDDMPKALVQNEIDHRSLLYQNYRPFPGYTGTRKY